MKEYGDDEQGKQVARMISIILLGFGLLFGIGYVLSANGIGESDSGPCSQYTSQEAIDFCVDNLPAP